MSEIRETATRRLDRALAETGTPDPRARYRELMKTLREGNPDGFQTASRYFEDVLTPSVADETKDPLGEWLEFGRVIASLIIEGDTVQIDESGLAGPYIRPAPADRLVLHLPRSPRSAAIAIGLPKQLSPAQAAAYALLVDEAVRLP